MTGGRQMFGLGSRYTLPSPHSEIFPRAVRKC
jgi:hypothetical protein